jgi:membrane protein YqaA with SNARE-associated domain
MMVHRAHAETNLRLVYRIRAQALFAVDHGHCVVRGELGYAHYGAWIILLKGLTPIPYKLVTITSGFANYNIWAFIALSVIARGGRFFVVAILLNRYGEWIRVRIEKHLGLWVAIGAGVLVLGFIVAFRLF